MKPFKSCLVAGMLAVVAPAALAESPEDFFYRYTELAASFDPAVAKLYDNSAKVRVFRIEAHKPQASLDLAGWQWKRHLAKAMPVARADGDISEYRNIEVSRVARGYKIKADRYSTLTCHTDRAYYMVISPNGRGSYAIAEEYTVVQADSAC